MNIRNITLLFSISLTIFLGSLSIVGSKHASAAYDGAKLIDNSVFLNSNTMSASQIQSFLSSMGSGLASRSFVLQCYGASSQERQLYTSVGAPCDQSIPASQIIYFASKIYGINPQVTLATLQKEQSLITTQNPTDWQLNQAMGYGCPTTGNCSGNSTFSYQIDSGVWALRYHYERANGNNSWWSQSSSWVCGTEKNFYKPNLYPGQNVSFYDGNNVLYRTYYLANAATSAMYCYTPHAYNNPQGLYGRPAFGTTGQYYSGSYNFVNSFEAWFKSTLALPTTCDSKVAGIVCVWSLRKTDGSQFLTSSKSEMDSAMANFGWTYYGLEFYASQTQKSGTVPVYRLRQNNLHFYTANQIEYNSLIASGSWLDEGIAFYAYPSTMSINASYNVFRLYKSTGNLYYLTSDTALRDYYISIGYVLQPSTFNSFSGSADLPVPAIGRNNIYKLRGNGSYFYTTNISELDYVIGRGYQYDGLLTTENSSNVGSPIYRLQRAGKYFYTSDSNERDSAVSRFAYIYEGIGFYLDNSSAEIYRLSNPVSNGYLYTSSVDEAMSVTNTNGWIFEGNLYSKNISPSPVYRFLNLFNHRHFYTIDINEAMRIVNRGWLYETIAFYADKNTGLPVYRLLSYDKHFYTIDENEKNNAVSKYKYQFEGIAYYASQTTTSTPVYRLQGGNDEYFYTTSSIEKDRAISTFGYRYEGVGFYLL